CLEACPTYTLTGDENDGPRGRIYLMRAVEEGRLKVESRAFERHINRCLGCRACEQACPAGVEYGQLLEAARAEISGTTAVRGWTSRWLRVMLKHVWLHPARLRFAFSCARLLRQTGLARLLSATPLARLMPARARFAFALLEASAPSARSISGRLRVNENGQRNENGRPAALLFKGCVMEGLFERINLATRRVLEVSGCITSAPAAQGCCGALHAHAGELEGARALARRNIEAFANESDAVIITNAGGCGAMLASYAQLLANDAAYAARAREFSARVLDISQQLAETGIRRGARLLDDKLTTYDASCHLLYGQGAGDAPLGILEAIPELNFVPLAESERCCGGAGVYNLLEAEMAARVLDEKLARLQATGAEVLATGNPGCHMQIGAGARLKKIEPLRVCHPIELLDESYQHAGFYQETTDEN
ncbi:MAG TPA: heterodisulfide reductase-related iron-sulfur binding cluster, partial [Pyrinomonadaceae bacterium]